MTALPPITISTLDLERLEDLLDTLPAHDPAAQRLRGELDRAQVLEPGEMPGDVVTMNSTACLRDAASGREMELTLSYPRHADGGSGRVSVLAPVGCALLGLSVGQEIDWPLPDGRNTRLQLLKIVYQPEAAGDLHR